jgi:hypothetical protein
MQKYVFFHTFISLFICLITSTKTASAQTSLTQTIQGTVLDKDSREPLIGATINVLNSNPDIGANTDAEGKFTLRNVPIGRQQLKCSYIGYETWQSDPIILNSARELTLNIELSEAAVQGKEAVVVAKKFGNESLNEAAILSTRSFSVDETQRYAASANDPSRMAMGFPGVQPSRDSRSDIVVRGNSGIGLLWRLEGVDIPNPNHFARRGSSGGGITVFSVSMLANSDFSTGAFPAEYGNAYSGVFDIHLRKGNAEKRQHTFRAGILGLELSTEGPFKKGGNATYLFNYRYSTLGILNKMGIHLVGARVDNTFQDLSFNIAMPTKNNKQLFTIWGIGGLSHEFEKAEEDQANWKSYTDYLTRDFDTNMGAIGVTHTAPLRGDAYIKTSLSAMGQFIGFSNDTLNQQRIGFTTNKEIYKENRLVLSSFINKKITTRAALKTGFFLNQINYDLNRITFADSSSIDAVGNTQLIQPYAQLRLRPSEKWTVNLGLHAMYLTLNQQKSLEPRLGIKYQANTQSSLSLAWGLHSRMLPIGNYFTRINGVEVNRDANFIRAQHLVAGYDWLPGKSLRFHAEAYVQTFNKVPIAVKQGSSWSILNTIDGFAKQRLENTGGGHNVGIDLSFEQSFKKGAFFLVSGSVSRSRYRLRQRVEFPTAFDSGLSGTFMGGKEWTMKNASVLQLGLKVLYNGGQRLTPLLAGQSVSRFSQDPILDESKAFSEKVDAYFRPDMRIAWRKNKTHSAWSIALDLQNIANKRNIDALSRSYDPDKNAWVFREQSGLTPVLSFQIDF